MFYGQIAAGLPVLGQYGLADALYTLATGTLLIDQRHHLAKLGVGGLCYYKWHAKMRAQHLLHLLGMNLYASAIDDIVLPADDAEAAAVGMKLCAVVGDQPLGTHARGIDNEAALAVERNADVGEGGVEASPVPSEGGGNG